MESVVKRVTLVSGGRSFPVEVQEKDGILSISLSGEPLAVEVGQGPHGGGGLSLLMGGRSYEARVVVHDRRITVEIQGERFSFEVDDAGVSGRMARRDGPGGRAEVTAPMPGKVVKLLVSAGESVEAGQGVLLFEAMKMQNEIRSPVAGSIVTLSVQEGQAVESRELLFEVDSARA